MEYVKYKEMKKLSSTHIYIINILSSIGWINFITMEFRKY